jgi:hypothetical protein
MCKSFEAQGKPMPKVCTEKTAGGAAEEGDQIGHEGADADVPDQPAKGKKGAKAAKGGAKKKAGAAKKKHAKK